MSPHNLLAYISVPALGGFAGDTFFKIIADTTNISQDGTLNMFIGPFGFLVGSIVAIKYLVCKLGDEQKYNRDITAQLAALSQTATEALARSVVVIEQNSHIIQKLKNDETAGN